MGTNQAPSAAANTLPPTLQRDASIDILRGSAVFTMVTAHTIFWTIANQGVTPLIYINELANISNTISFTTFLFCFGFGLYKAVLKRDSNIRSIKKTGARVGQLITLYLGLSYFQICFLSGAPLTLNLTISVLLLQTHAPFTEYLVPFILFSALLPIVHFLFPHIFAKALNRKRVIWTLTLSLILSVYSVYLSKNPLYLTSLTPIVTGLYGNISFPLIPYLPVLLAGAALAHHSENSDYNHVTHTITQFALLVACATLILPYVFSLFHGVIKTDFATSMFRWPPSLLFLTQSLTFTLAWLVIVRASKFPKVLARALNFLGNHSLMLVGFHLVVLFSYNKYISKPMRSLAALATILGIFLCYAALTKISGFIVRKISKKNMQPLSSTEKV